MMKSFTRTLPLLACLCFGCVHPQSTATAPSTTTSNRFHQLAIGLCEDYPEESRSLAAARRDLEVLRTNNIRTLRIAFGWDAMEPERGKFDWSFWDDFVRIAVDDYGIRLIPYVCYTPRWASASTNEDFWQQPPRDNADFTAFMKQIVARYHERIHSWELWNEPDNAYYWRGSPEQFAELLRAGSDAVHAADPRATIVMGGLAWNLSFLEMVLNHPGALQHVGVINLHNYYETWASEPLEDIPDYTGRAADLLSRHGEHQSLWLAEAGYSSFRRGDHVSDQYTATFAEEHTPEAQAAALFRVLALTLASGNISLVAWYRINDLPETQEVIGDVNNRHLGILDEHGRAKPALRSLHFFQSLFPGGYRCLDGAVRVRKEIASPAEIHAFEKPDGTVVVTAWLKTYRPGHHGESSPQLDSREASIDVTLPFPVERTARSFDELGLPRGTFRISPERTVRVLLRDGHVTVLTLQRRGAHQQP
jgi:hypothetical protein